MADFQVPLAFGTQTGGSTIRPAAYCGIVGYKPTFGEIPVAGAKPIAASFDTITMFARTVDDVALFRSALLGGEADEQPVAAGVGGSPRIGFCRTSVWDEAGDAQKSAVEAAVEALSRVAASVTEVELPGDARNAHLLQDTIFSYEMSRSLAAERFRHRDKLSKVLREEGLPPGDRISIAEYHDACRRIDRARCTVDALFDERYDIVITPSATGEAPLGLGLARRSSVWDGPGCTFRPFPSPSEGARWDFRWVSRSSVGGRTTGELSPSPPGLPNGSAR